MTTTAGGGGGGQVKDNKPMTEESLQQTINTGGSNGMNGIGDGSTQRSLKGSGGGNSGVLGHRAVQLKYGQTYLENFIEGKKT